MATDGILLKLLAIVIAMNQAEAFVWRPNPSGYYNFPYRPAYMKYIPHERSLPSHKAITSSMFVVDQDQPSPQSMDNDITRY
jgi:hypothetical protein